VNPQRGYVLDDRYNPCRAHSKLGVPLSDLVQALEAGIVDVAALDGLHFHSHCESSSYQPLIELLEHVERALPEVFASIRWLNMGGGYRGGADHADSLADMVARLNRRYGFEVFMEPGKAIVGDAGCLIASVIDLFDSGGKTLAVLDTSVNHQPEVFEYGRVPAVAEAETEGPYRYLLAGGTCLAGDLFGDYGFAEPLAIGSRITFLGVGAYSLAKSHRFNGHNLPSIYLRKPDGQLHLLKDFDYDDFRRQWGGN
jgi:carboxynorspermidine decarboxylase